MSVKGFKASSIAAGLKKNKSYDMALIYSEREAVAAGVFTTNKVKAAPVLLSMEHILKGRARAIIANAGNANACTGSEGIRNAELTAELVAGELGIKKEEVLVASTGVIGAQMDMVKVAGAIPGLVGGLSEGNIPLAAEAIMTTDSFPKISIFEGKAGNHPYRILGIAKGAGMIMPDMATMLSFIITDINIEREELKKAISSSVAKTFNRITVDGDTSTNDTVFVLANGAAGNDKLNAYDYEGFRDGLKDVMNDLAVMIVKDGEGASKLVHINIEGAASEKDAMAAARNIANSFLVKTAFYGQDANWGRIMAALGRSGIAMEEKYVSIWIDDIRIVDSGMAVGAEQEKAAAERMKNSSFSVKIKLNIGDYQYKIVTCDLTHEYISINANYRT
ncbi:MAG: bifunctional glutamate N-acetyltransferase/amino-acid acetyltransferase ArgJ [Deltaproteobacteria bacterium]|nr:bifunctional glutamate N-acetyltransferase/amino-acid acetyltransferase ArgJ [Deltaproteobacteria bacterium]